MHLLVNLLLLFNETKNKILQTAHISMILDNKKILIYTEWSKMMTAEATQERRKQTKKNTDKDENKTKQNSGSASINNYKLRPIYKACIVFSKFISKTFEDCSMVSSLREETWAILEQSLRQEHLSDSFYQ